MSALNYEISSLVRPNWEYESFWAIPRIGETKPIVAISLLAGKNTVNVRCLDPVSYTHLTLPTKA